MKKCFIDGCTNEGFHEVRFDTRDTRTVARNSVLMMTSGKYMCDECVDAALDIDTLVRRIQGEQSFIRVLSAPPPDRSRPAGARKPLPSVPA